MSIVITTLLLGMILLQCSVGGNPLICTFGEKLHTSKEGIDNCIMCPRGTFMSEEHHTNRQCYNCSRIENPTLEVEITMCNGTHDAVIDCICGYYRYMPRTKDEKEECRKYQDCHVPVNTTSSYQSSGPESTTLIGVTGDAENRTRGMSVSTDTLHSQDQNKTNQSQNGVTECQISVRADEYEYVILYVALILILISNFVNFVYTVKPDTKHSRSSVACSRLTTPRILTVTLVLLCLLLLICALLKSGAIALPHYASNVFVIITVPAAVFYVIALSILIKRHKKLQVNEESQPGTVKLEDRNSEQAHKLIQIQEDSE